MPVRRRLDNLLGLPIIGRLLRRRFCRRIAQGEQRVEVIPATRGRTDSGFIDVPRTEYYAAPVAWAAANGEAWPFGDDYPAAVDAWISAAKGFGVKAVHETVTRGTFDDFCGKLRRGVPDR